MANFYQVKRMIRGLKGVALDLFSNFKKGKIQEFLCRTVGFNNNSKRAIFGKQNWR